MRARLLTLLCGGLLLVVGPIAGADKPDADAKPIPVEVSKPISLEVTDYEIFTGRTEALEQVDLRARLGGEVVKVNFKGGSTVRKGDLLFELDARPYQAEVDKASAEVQRAQARLDRLARDLERAKTQLNAKTMSREEYDRIAGDHQEAEAGVRSAKVGLERAKLDLEYTRVTAPISGTIGRPLLTVGNYATAGTTSLANIVSNGPLAVDFNIDERTFLELNQSAAAGKLANWRDGNHPVQMALASDNGFKREGKVDFVDSHVDPSNGTVRARAVFPNADGSLVPGLFARVHLATSKPYKAVLVTDHAVLKDATGSYVRVVNAKNTIEDRKVQIGRWEGEMRVVKEGLTVDDLVIVPTVAKPVGIVLPGWPDDLRPGLEVKPKVVPMRGQPEKKPAPDDK